MSAYTIRRLLPQDATGVAECFRRIYGASYLHADVYHPDQFLQAVESGRLMSVVALDGCGEVVGHYALERPTLGRIAEEGEALVLPEHRQHGLMDLMHELLEKEAIQTQLAGLFGQAVTNHPFTQKVHERFGLSPCALKLGATPRSFHNLPEPLAQRLSLLLGFKYLHPPMSVTVHLPPQHQAMCLRLYEAMQLPVDQREPQAPGAKGEMTIERTPEAQTASIRVTRGGTEVASALRQARRDLCEREGMEAVYLELPLSDPTTPWHCTEAESDGFFFSGIGPCFADEGDALCLQFLNTPIDARLIQIDSPLARVLADYVEEQRQAIAS